MHSGYVDVLIMTALPEELAAVLALGDGGEAEWKRMRDRSGSTYHLRAFTNERGDLFLVAAAWSGQSSATGVRVRAEKLIDELSPGTLALCGTCSGVSGVRPGDVIVADKVIEFDKLGPRAARSSDEPSAEAEAGVRDLGAAWRIDATLITRDIRLGDALVDIRPRSFSQQRRWLLHTLYDYESYEHQFPISHPDRQRMCPDWSEMIRTLRATKDLVDTPGALELTEQGRSFVREERLLNPEGVPDDPPPRIRMGTLVAVAKQPNRSLLQLKLLSIHEKATALDGDSGVFADLGATRSQQTMIVKGVSQMYGERDDSRFSEFAARAAAASLHAILRKSVIPEDRHPAPTSRRDVFLERVSIRDFKSIHQLDIQFTTPSELPGRWTCIAGLNGAGKSAVLQAIALLLLGDRLAQVVGDEWLSRSRRRQGDEPQASWIRATVRSGQELIPLMLPLGAMGVDLAALEEESNYHRMRVFWNARLQSHILLSYGAGRNLSEYRDTRHHEKSLDVRRQMTLFDPLTQVASVDVLLDQGERAKPVLTMLKRLLDAVLDGVALTVEESDAGLQFRCGDAIVPASELPDGFRATIAWLADICAAWHEKAPEEAKDGDPSKIRAIVLIDEIDLHLHARLQRVLVPRLRKALPEVQWIVTTHSPLVISSFDRREIVLLKPGPQGPERHELDRQILGFSTDEVYEYLMEIPPRSAALESEIEGTGGARLAEILAQSPKVNEEQAKQDRAWMDDLARHLRESQTKGDPEDGSP